MDEKIPNELAFKVPPKIDVYRKIDMRLRLCNVTAKEAAEYAGVSEGFVWSCARAKHKVASESGYVFHINPDSIGYAVMSMYDDEDGEGSPDYRIDRKLLYGRITAAGFRSVETFAEAIGSTPGSVRKRIYNGFKTFPRRDVTMEKICEYLNLSLEELVIGKGEN